MQSPSSTQSTLLTAPTGLRLSESTVNNDLGGRMMLLEIESRSSSGSTTAAPTISTSGSMGPPYLGSAGRSWPSRNGTNSSLSLVSKNERCQYNGNLGGGQHFRKTIRSRGSKILMEGNEGSLGNVTGAKRRNGRGRGKARRTKFNVQDGASGASGDDNINRRSMKGRKPSPRKGLTMYNTERVQSRDDSQQKYRNLSQSKDSQRFDQYLQQSRYGYLQDRSKFHQQRMNGIDPSRIAKNSILQKIQSCSSPPSQLTNLSLCRYEFHMTEFLELMHLLTSLEVLDLEIISVLSLTSISHICPQRQQSQNNIPSPSLSRNDGFMQYRQHNSNCDSEDDDRMIIDQGEFAQKRHHLDTHNSLLTNSCETCAQIKLDNQFPTVKSLTFRGTIVIPELLRFLPNLEALSLERMNDYQPHTSSTDPNISRDMFNANSQKSLYSSTYGETKTRKGYGSNVFYTDSDSDSLLSATANVRLQESSANDSCQHKNETPISIMISNLAQSLLEGCPQLSRLVVNESLLIEDHEGIQDPSLRGQPQQLAMLIQAIPKLKEFVAHMCVVAKCPGLIETLLEYHHPHLVSFKVLHDTHEVDPHHLQRPSLQHLQQIDQQKPYQQEYQQQQTQEEYHQYPEQQWQQQQQPSLFQRILQLQQQQQQQQLEYLTRLRQGCLRILELCPELKEFESEIPLVLEDLIASVPRWACERALRVLRLEVQELTVDGGLDPEEEGVMQMFITSLFKSSRSQQHRRDPQLQLESQLQLEPQSEPLSVRLNAPYSISTDQSATGSSSSNATGSTAGYRASSGSISSSSDNSISGGSGNWTSSGSQEVLSVPPNLPGSGIGHTASSSDIYAESISETSSFSQSLSSMSISPTNIKEQPLVGDECDGNAASWTSSSDQSSFESGKGLRGSNRRHHHRHQNQHPYQHHLHRRTIHNQNCTYNHASDLVQTRQPMPSPPPPPMPQDESLSMAAIPSPYSTRLPSYYQIGAVGRLVALQFLIEHQLVYLPKLDQLFLGNRMYTIPSIDRSS